MSSISSLVAVLSGSVILIDAESTPANPKGCYHGGLQMPYQYIYEEQTILVSAYSFHSAVAALIVRSLAEQFSSIALRKAFSSESREASLFGFR